MDFGDIGLFSTSSRGHSDVAAVADVFLFLEQINTFSGLCYVAM